MLTYIYNSFVFFTTKFPGAVQGMVTGMRGLCNGLGPAMFGVVFYLFNVDLNNEQSVASNEAEADDKWFNFPGPPFVFGGFMVILAILVALFIPEVHGDTTLHRTPSEKKRKLNIFCFICFIFLLFEIRLLIEIISVLEKGLL